MSLTELHEEIIKRDWFLHTQIGAKNQARRGASALINLIIQERFQQKLPNETSRKAARRSEDDEN